LNQQSVDSLGNSSKASVHYSCIANPRFVCAPSAAKMIRAVQWLTAALALAHVGALAHAGGLEATFGADDDDTSTKTGDVDCVMGQWSAWTKCTAQCACGQKTKVRVAITAPKGGGKACPYDTQAMTCNCKDCGVGSDKPTASLHLTVPTMYKPDGGFSSKDAEQGACVLDKTAAIIDLYLGVKECHGKWDGKVGEQCYGKSAEHLVHHTKKCCQGRDSNFKQWQSDVLCTRLTASLVSEINAVIVPAMKKCVDATPASHGCDALQSKHTFHIFAKIGMHGLKAAQQLYTRGKASDLTEDAASLLHACDAKGSLQDDSGKTIESWSSPETAKCETHVANYVRSWASPETMASDFDGSRRRLLRGAK